MTKDWGDANKNWNLYISNFFSCDFCNALHGDTAACAEGLKTHFRYQFCTLQRYAPAAWLPRPLMRLCMIIGTAGAVQGCGCLADAVGRFFSLPDLSWILWDFEARDGQTSDSGMSPIIRPLSYHGLS